MSAVVSQVVLVVVVAVFILFITLHESSSSRPRVIVTWNFTSARDAAWRSLWPPSSASSALDAVQAGCDSCQRLQCDFTVGFGGSPDENGHTTLDALIMDGDTLDVGAVGALDGVRDAVGVARAVLDHTHHSFLAGCEAKAFALQMGFEAQATNTNQSLDKWRRWRESDCQPNFWKAVVPDPTTSCGPYTPAERMGLVSSKSSFAKMSDHDTIGMVAIDAMGSMAAGTSTNGASHKIPGRIGDSPIPGAGAYVDSEVGGAAATGDGDLMLRALPTFLAVESLRSGMSAPNAALTAVERLRNKFPSFNGAVVVLTKTGEFGAACHGFTSFPFAVAGIDDNGDEFMDTRVVQCSQNQS